METLVAQTFSFGDFELDGAKRLLLKQGKPVSLNSKAFDLLYVLVENHGQIVHKEELFDKVWEGQFVEENNLTVHISALRKIFGERKNDHQFIATIPGKGYKFVADVRLPFEKSEQKKLNDLAVSQNNLTVSASREFETTLIGREREIAEIKDLLRQNDVNLVTLTGAGGSGKTALARGVTDELKADFADGVFFVELAAVNQAELVIGAIAQALDVKESSEKSLFDALKDFLRSREILLVLDNFEQLISAAPLLQKLINSTAFLKILVTSRHVLKIDIERETVVTPLSLPPRDMVLTDENSSEYAAVELFIRRAQNIRRNFVLTGENASFVAEICRRLDGLPLAIELAAARVKLLSPQSILERLENSLNLLTGGKQDLPARQQTMRGAIQWSYDLLNEDEKAVLRQLSVFADGFTVKAAEAVCDLSERSGWLILDLFTALIDNNLLAVKEQKNGEVRLKMLEVVREFAFERLESHSETDKLKQNHAEYFLALAKETEPHLSDGKGGEWLGNLEVEIDNLRAALRWFLETDAESAAHLAAATREFWASYCYLTEGCEWLEKVLERSSKTPSEIRFKLLYGLGFLARQKGDFKTSQKAHEQGLKDGKAVGDRRQIAWSYRGLGAVAFRQNDFKSAREFIGKALQISRETDDKPGTANALNLLGDIYQAEGNLVVARPLLEESMAILKELEYKQAVGSVICNLGIVSYRQGDFAVANSYFLEALATAQEVGQKQLVSVCLDGFAALAIVQTKSNLAAQMAGAAEHLRETIGYEIEPSERLFRKDYEKKIRRALDEKTFDTAYQKGRTLALNEIVALAENSFSEEQINEIIVETHKFERVIIEEEIEKDAEFSNEYETKQINSAKRKTGVSDWLRNYFVILIGAVLLLAIIGGFYFWRQGRQSNFSSEVFVAPTNIKQLTTNGNFHRHACAGRKSLRICYQ